MVRKIILAILGVVIIGGSYVMAKRIIANKQQRAPRPEQKIITGVFVDEVTNASLPIVITTSGNLMAKNRVELYSEVQGIFNYSRRAFKEGTWYRKGESLLKLDNKEEVISLKAQKSSFYNQLVNLIPDLRLDYPETIDKWNLYINNYDVNDPIADLPDPNTEKEKLFLSGRNIYTPYYNVKNSESQLRHYTIRAPFSGILTEALVNKGALIRPGQKLGEFISPDVYELEVAINAAYDDLITVGKSVSVTNIEKTKEWIGKVIRVNSLVDPTSQTIPTFIQISGKGLREGMFLEANVTAKEEINTYEVDRKLLVENDKLFIVRDSLLDMVQVNPIFFKEKTVVVKGLQDGTKLVSKSIPGAYIGMLVKVFKNEPLVD